MKPWKRGTAAQPVRRKLMAVETRISSLQENVHPKCAVQGVRTSVGMSTALRALTRQDIKGFLWSWQWLTLAGAPADVRTSCTFSLQACPIQSPPHTPSHRRAIWHREREMTPSDASHGCHFTITIQDTRSGIKPIKTGNRVNDGYDTLSRFVTTRTNSTRPAILMTNPCQDG